MFVLLLFLSIVYFFSSLSYLHSFFHVNSAKGNNRCAFAQCGVLHRRKTIFPQFSAFCLQNRDVYIQRFSSISVIDCKSVFDFVTKPCVPTGIDDERCAVDMAIIRGCLRRMTLHWIRQLLVQSQKKGLRYSAVCERVLAVLGFFVPLLYMPPKRGSLEDVLCGVVEVCLDRASSAMGANNTTLAMPRTAGMPILPLSYRAVRESCITVTVHSQH